MDNKFNKSSVFIGWNWILRGPNFHEKKVFLPLGPLCLLNTNTGLKVGPGFGLTQKQKGVPHFVKIEWHTFPCSVNGRSNRKPSTCPLAHGIRSSRLMMLSKKRIPRQLLAERAVSSCNVTSSFSISTTRTQVWYINCCNCDHLREMLQCAGFSFFFF